MITLDYTNVMADTIGERDGILREELLSLNYILREAHYKIQKNIDKQYYFLKLPNLDTTKIKDYANYVRENFEYFVLVGIGGSSLGTEMLVQSLRWINYNQFHFPKFFVLDNVEPEKVASVLELIDIKKTCFNVISKSGSTIETIANFMVILDLLKDKVGENWNKHLVITTDPDKGFLRDFAKKYNIKTFDIPPNVSGRFSVLSAVGLFPASTIGIDIDEILAGAKRMKQLCLVEEHVEHNPAYLIAVLHFLANMRRKKSIAVMMPYIERLNRFVDWWRQLWAESLGKDELGQTPVKAMGTIDQHSQIQLYREGIKDKIITFITVDNPDRDIKIPEDLPEDLEFLKGKTLNQLLKGELIGTKATFIKSKVPNLTITLDKLSPYNIGMLIILYELATAISGFLYKVNPFDQPAVEEGKEFMYAWIGKKGYEDKLEELEEIYKEKYTLNIK